jgi:hypothetical protein
MQQNTAKIANIPIFNQASTNFNCVANTYLINTRNTLFDFFGADAPLG